MANAAAREKAAVASIRTVTAPPAEPEVRRIGGVPVADLAARFGTPLYVFDAAVLRERVAMVQAALGPRLALLWSIKANPSLAVTAVLRQAGTAAELASLGELHLARAAGHPAASLRFAGPGKTDAELTAALQAGVGCFHVESLDEIAALARLAASTTGPAKVALRINLAQELGGARMRMGGHGSRFGIDADAAPTAARAVLAAPSLQLVGLHVYGGTQLFDAAAFVRQAEQLCELAAVLEQQLGTPICELDLGGGFGVPAYAGDPEFDLAAAGRGLQAVLARHDRADRTWFVELGRFLCAPAGTYLTRVVRTKRSGTAAHAIVDGGMHQHAAAAGVGTVVRRPPLLERADGRPGQDEVSIGGPLCTPADQFAAALPIGPLAPGDLLLIRNSGAYGLTYSPHGFLSHPTPAEVMVDGGVARVVRQRGDAAAVLSGQSL
jgi:diaminopimelate decarboxylase